MFESVEADSEWNDRMRADIASMHETHGQAWLVRLNGTGNLGSATEPILWKWDGSLVHNFEADAVLPAFDHELLELIETRNRTIYTNVKADKVHVDAIFARIDAAGGKPLVWT